MPDRPTAGFAGATFHVVNRAIHRQLICRDFGEYLSFVHILRWSLHQSAVDLFAFSVMPNHFHLLVRPVGEKDLPIFMHRLQMTHALSLRRWRGTEGRGAVYQGRYRASRVHDESYFYRAARYVERNPVRAGLSERPDEWLWSSASPIAAVQGIRLATWPVPRPAGWTDFVNQVEPESDLAFIRRRFKRREPLIEADLEAATPATQPAGVAADSDER
jgi:putative transposase